MPAEPAVAPVDAEEVAAESFLDDLDGPDESLDDGPDTDPFEDAAAETAPPDPTTPVAAPDGEAAPTELAEPVAASDPNDALLIAASDAAMKDAAPFAYVLDGQRQEIPFATHIPNVGIVIEEKDAPGFQTMLANAHRIYTENGTLRKQVDEYRSLGGREKMADLEVKADVLSAGLRRLLSIIDNDEQLVSLASDPRERAYLKRELDIMAAETASTAARRVQTAQDSGTAEASQRTAQQQSFFSTIQEFGKALPDLTPDDLRAMAETFGPLQDRMFRRATTEDAARLGIAVGSTVRDPTFMHGWAKDRSAWRKEQKGLVAKAEAAAKENAARLSGGKPAAPARTTARTTTRIASGNAPKKLPSRSELIGNLNAGRLGTMSQEKYGGDDPDFD